MPPPQRAERQATVEELRALAHPVRWRILRLCLDNALTNQQLAARLDLSPATTLRHVRALVKAEFLTPEPVRSGAKGALERPYRATRRTWGLNVLDLDEPELGQRMDLAVLAAHRDEMLAAGPDSGRDLARGVLRLGPSAQAELRERLVALVTEFAAREEADGEPLSYLWSLAVRPPEA
jgi:predicted ArsR family transcriptional regulator